MASDAAVRGAIPPTTLTRAVVAATIGNVLEWFDFVIYGFLAVTIAEVFFPTGNPTVSLLVALSNDRSWGRSHSPDPSSKTARSAA